MLIFASATPRKILSAWRLATGRRSGWITEGWWHVNASSCTTLVVGPLTSRYYYLYAEDAQSGGRWDGKVNMCVAENQFKITGINDCFARGFQRPAFRSMIPASRQAGWSSLRKKIPPSSPIVTDTPRSMRRRRKVKILATLGPASSDEAMIRKLFEAGADVFRINMSHASHDLMRELVRRLRNVEKEVGRPIGILADLQGPKLRVGKFKDGKVDLVAGQTFTLDDNDTPGDNTRVFLPHPEILEAVEPGHRLLIDDGKLALVAEASDGKSHPLPRRFRNRRFPTRRASACPIRRSASAP